jgi:hypothetical protein
MPRRVARQRDHQNFRFAIAHRPHSLEAKPVFATLTIERPVGPMLPLIRNISAFWRSDLMRHGDFVFSAMEMHFRPRKVRNAAGVVAVEMRQQQVPDVAWRVTERLDLLNRCFGGIQPRRGLPHPFAPKPVRPCDVVHSDAGIDEGKTIGGLDQQTMTNHSRPLEHAAGAVHETPPDRTHGAGVEMMNAHGQPFPGNRA